MNASLHYIWSLVTGFVNTEALTSILSAPVSLSRGGRMQERRAVLAGVMMMMVMMMVLRRAREIRWVLRPVGESLRPLMRTPSGWRRPVENPEPAPQPGRELTTLSQQRHPPDQRRAAGATWESLASDSQTLLLHQDCSLNREFDSCSCKKKREQAAFTLQDLMHWSDILTHIQQDQYYSFFFFLECWAYNIAHNYIASTWSQESVILIHNFIKIIGQINKTDIGNEQNRGNH